MQSAWKAGRWGAAAYRWGQSRSLLGGSRPATRAPSIPASIGGGQLMQPWRRPPGGVPATEVDKLRERSMPAIQERHTGLLWLIPSRTCWTNHASKDVAVLHTAALSPRCLVEQRIGEHQVTRAREADRPAQARASCLCKVNDTVTSKQLDAQRTLTGDCRYEARGCGLLCRKSRCRMPTWDTAPILLIQAVTVSDSGRGQSDTIGVRRATPATASAAAALCAGRRRRKHTRTSACTCAGRCAGNRPQHCPR